MVVAAVVAVVVAVAAIIWSTANNTDKHNNSNDNSTTTVIKPAGIVIGIRFALFCRKWSLPVAVFRRKSHCQQQQSKWKLTSICC